MKLSNLLSVSSCLAALAVTPVWARIHQGSAMEGLADAANFQMEQAQRMRSFLGPPEPQNVKRDTEALLPFRSPQSKRFFVDGTKLPDGMIPACRYMGCADGPAVNFDPGPSWSGLMPISSNPHETRKLFFW